MEKTGTILILGSGPNATEVAQWPRHWFDRIVTINNAWRIRPDWDDLVFPEDFAPDRRPTQIAPHQRLIEAEQFIPAQNAFGGCVYAGGTMAFTTGYWALHSLRPRVMAFMGCDMVYPKTGNTHFYGTGSADPLRPDVTLQDLGAKSARLALLAVRQGCACVNLSTGPSQLVFDRAAPNELHKVNEAHQSTTPSDVIQLLRQEADLGYVVPSGRYWEEQERFDSGALARLDGGWRSAWGARAA